MILKKKNNYWLNVYLIICTLLITTSRIFAQNEIPENIKDYILKGVESLESSKTSSDIETAYTLFTKAVEITPNYPDAHYFLGKTLSLMQGNTERAIKELNLYIQLYPEAPDKEQINNEILELEKLADLKKNSYLMGISLVELSDGIYVHRVSPNYPSFGRRGVPIKTGDKIIKINDTDISGFSLQSVLKVFADDSLNTDKPRKIIVVRGGEEHGLDMYKRNTDFEPIIKDLGEEDLASMIKNASKPLIVFFISDWCNECQYYFNDRSIDRPTYTYNDDITFIYANIDERNSLAKEFGVEKYPTLHFYKNGKLVDKIIGYEGDLYREKADDLID